MQAFGANLRLEQESEPNTSGEQHLLNIPHFFLKLIGNYPDLLQCVLM